MTGVEQGSPKLRCLKTLVARFTVRQLLILLCRRAAEVSSRVREGRLLSEQQEPRQQQVKDYAASLHDEFLGARSGRAVFTSWVPKSSPDAPEVKIKPSVFVRYSRKPMQCLDSLPEYALLFSTWEGGSMSFERRRARCDVGHRRGFLVASAALGAALMLPIGARAAQIKLLQGAVRVNGKKASKATPIRPGDTVETSKGARLAFVVGDDAFLLRGESKLMLEHTSGEKA